MQPLAFSTCSQRRCNLRWPPWRVQLTGLTQRSAPQTSVPGNRNNAKLENLLPDTAYSITVEPLYLEGPGAELSGNGRTSEIL